MTPFERSDRLLIERIVDRRRDAGRPILAGLCGAQGSGKSHTAARLVAQLGELGYPAVALSIDDFYLTRAERQALAATIHPLLATRGVPGTHDVPLAERTLAGLLAGAAVALPSFDKTIDDRVPEQEWRLQCAAVSVVILEGWCVGAEPQPAEALTAPVNTLEANEDRDGRWRTYVNDQLAGPYRALFEMIDLSILLAAPSFDQVLGWRTEQERGLARTASSHAPMDEPALRRFIAHYERITRAILATEPAEIVVPIGPDRAPLGHRSGRRTPRL